MELRDRAAIAGVGYTPFSKNSGVSTLTLAIDAITAALDDAGLTVDDVDAPATHRVGDSTPPLVVAPALGIGDVTWYLDQFGGGSVSHAVVGQAAMAVATGAAPVFDTQYQAPYGYSRRRSSSPCSPART